MYSGGVTMATWLEYPACQLQAVDTVFFAVESTTLDPPIKKVLCSHPTTMPAWCDPGTQEFPHGCPMWNYSKGGIDLGREMVNYTSTNVSYANDADIIAAFLNNPGGDESNTKNKRKVWLISTLILG